MPILPTVPPDPRGDDAPVGGFGATHQHPLTAAAMNSALSDHTAADGAAGAALPPEVLESRRPIDPARVAALITGDRPWRVTHTTVTGSTNADLAASAGLPNSELRL